MHADALYPLITQAILDAEALDARRDPAAKRAHLEVSQLEERLAELTAPAHPVGAIARSSAVGAAIRAGDIPRARRLARNYCAEPQATEALRADIAEILAPFDAAAHDLPPSWRAMTQDAAAVFPLRADADFLLRLAPAPTAPRLPDAATAYAALRGRIEAYADHASFGLDGEPRARLSPLAEALRRAAPPELPRCAPLTLERALARSLHLARSLAEDGAAEGEALRVAELESLNAQLPELFPQLATFRERIALDALLVDAATADAQRILLNALREAAQDDAVLADDLREDLREDALTLAELAGPATADARLSVKSAACKSASVYAALEAEVREIPATGDAVAPIAARRDALQCVFAELARASA